MNSRSNW